MIYWYRVPKSFDGEGWGPSVSGKTAVICGEEYVVANDAPLEGYEAITEDAARELLPTATVETMINNATVLPKTHTVEVTIEELGRIATGDFSLTCDDSGFKVDDWLRLIEVDANGTATGAGLYPLVIDAVTPAGAGQVDLTFGMAIE